jgi:hypothetical protein
MASKILSLAVGGYRSRNARRKAMKRIEDIEVLAPVNLPPDPNPHELRFAPPVGTCDTHFHIFGPHLFPFVRDRARYDDVVTVAHALVERSRLA